MSALTSTRPSDFRSATKDLSRWSSSSADDLANPEIQDAFVRGLHGIAQSYAGASIPDRAYFRDRMYGALRGVTGVDDQPLLTKSGVSHNKTTLDDERRRLADGMYSVVKSHRDDLKSLRDKGDTKTLGWYADTVRDWAKTYGFDDTHTQTGSSMPKTESESQSRSKKLKHRNKDDTTLATTKGSSRYDYPNAGMQPTKSALKKSSRRTDGDTSDNGSRSEIEDGGKSSKRRRKEGASGEGKSRKSRESTRDKRRRQQRKEGSDRSDWSKDSQSESDSESEADLRSTTPSKSSRSRSRSRQETQPDWEGRSGSEARVRREDKDKRGRPKQHKSPRSRDTSSGSSDSGEDSDSDSGYSSGGERRSRSRARKTESDASDRTSRSGSRSKSKSRSGSRSRSEKHHETIDASKEDDSLRGGSQTKSAKSRKDRKRKSRAESDESHSSQRATDSEDAAALNMALVSHSGAPRAESAHDTQVGGVTSADIESMVAAEVQKRLAHALAGDSPAHSLGFHAGTPYPPSTRLGQDFSSQFPYQPTGYSAPSIRSIMGDTRPTQHAQTTQHQLANTGYFNPEQVSRIMHEAARRPYVHPRDFKSHAREVITRHFGSSTDGSRVVDFEDHYGNKARGRKYLEAGGTVTTIDYDYDTASASASASSPRGAMGSSSVYAGGPAGVTTVPDGLRSGYDPRDPRMMEYPQSLGFAPSMGRSFLAPTVY